jgi:outer membrane protein
VIRLFALCLALTLPAAAGGIGYVDSAALLARHPAVRQADANLEALQKQLQRRLETEAEQLQKDVARLQERFERGELSPKEQETEAAEIDRRTKALHAQERDAVTTLEAKRTSELKPIYDEINAAIEKVAEREKLDFIFDRGVMLYALPELDRTDAVRAEL